MYHMFHVPRKRILFADFKKGLGSCPKHMSFFLAAFPKMLFELEHHKEEERRFVRLLMQFFCLVRLGAICNLLQTTVESVGWGQRHSHPPCECTWVLSILDEYVLCKSIPYEFIWFFSCANSKIKRTAKFRYHKNDVICLKSIQFSHSEACWPNV